jgi:hypothetical protein
MDDLDDIADKLGAVELNVEVPPPQMFQGDCMDIMAKLPDESVDLKKRAATKKRAEK